MALAPGAGQPKLVFRQLFDSESCTYTYVLGDAETREAVIIDPVVEKVERDLKVVDEMGLKLTLVIDTHAHADHITAAAAICDRRTGVSAAIGAAAGLPQSAAPVQLADGATVRFGAITLEARATPGHTNGCTSFHLASHGLVFTGDALLIRGCGRTNFQQGDANKLYNSVHSKLFSLPDDTVVYPAHDYNGITASTIGEEKRLNPRLTKDRDGFVAFMAGLGLPYPKQIDRALPANMAGGRIPTAAAAAAAGGEKK